MYFGRRIFRFVVGQNPCSWGRRLLQPNRTSFLDGWMLLWQRRVGLCVEGGPMEWEWKLKQSPVPCFARGVYLWGSKATGKMDDSADIPDAIRAIARANSSFDVCACAIRDLTWLSRYPTSRVIPLFLLFDPGGVTKKCCKARNPEARVQYAWSCWHLKGSSL